MWKNSKHLNLLTCCFLLFLIVIACKNTERKSTRIDNSSNSNISESKEIIDSPTPIKKVSPTEKVKQRPENLSIKIVSSRKGIYEFGLAKIQTEGVKTIWKNNGDVPIYGINYLFIESNSRGKSLRRKDVTRRLILGCKKNEMVVVMPDETFITLDMLSEKTVSYEVKTQEINPKVSSFEMAKSNCEGEAVSINYNSLNP